MKQLAGSMLLSLPPETKVRLDRFASLLTRWNSRINLIAARDLPNLWARHILDSVQLAPLIPPGSTITDLGSGAGFPGLIIAICTGNPVTLVEADTRKASFLREAARETATRAVIVNTRIERAAIPPAEVVTARALAPLPLLLEWAAPLLAPDGFCLFPKGRKAEDELTDAAAKWHMTIARTPSRTDPDGVILTLSHIRRIGAQQGRPDA